MAQETGKVLWTGDDLHFSIGRDTLLNGAFFSIMDGERVALVGRNGSGKSTLLRIITGQEKLDSGTVTQAKDLRVSFMPQDFDWIRGSTVLACTIKNWLPLVLGPLFAMERAPRKLNS